ncbi:MAG: glycosyltransferase, partial [Dehalococcoidia bacterium]|nr:glycosyltransferase [Dehalococcoidia bacterium]
MTTLDIAVVIVSWNVRELLARCLDSLIDRADQPAEIVVVDNGSTDGSPEMTRRRYPNVALIELPDNPGFAAANNRG